MGLEMLPDELLLSLSDQWICREQQLRQLHALLSPSLPSPPTIVVHGPQATGKSRTVEAYLEASKIHHAFINCRECVTERHLLERTVAAISDGLLLNGDGGGAPANSGRCENISVFVTYLDRSISRQGKYVLVFDGIDRQREASPTLLPAIARLGEFVSNLVVVLVVKSAPPRFLHHPGVPHIHFPAYTRNQSIQIISREPPDIFPSHSSSAQDYDDEVHDEDKAWLWPRFCAAVWDSLGQSVARDLESFTNVCHKFWRPFVAPIVKGDFGTRDFTRLLVAQRKLFQHESLLLDSLVEASNDEAGEQATRKTQHELPYYAKWLLIAGYLASTNPVRFDALYFMKATERKRRKKGGGTARSGTKASKHRRIPRQLLAPSPFTLDRLLSIFHAILPDELRSTIDIYTQTATLTRLRLLVRAAGIGSSDPLEAGGKWRVGPAVSWEFVLGLARSLDFSLIDYVVE